MGRSSTTAEPMGCQRCSQDKGGLHLVKLFHLSILFWAGVSSRPCYREVSLGPHQETLRQLILNRDPGSPHQYPVLGRASNPS